MKYLCMPFQFFHKWVYLYVMYIYITSYLNDFQDKSVFVQHIYQMILLFILIFSYGIVKFFVIFTDDLRCNIRRSLYTVTFWASLPQWKFHAFVFWYNYSRKPKGLEIASIAILAQYFYKRSQSRFRLKKIEPELGSFLTFSWSFERKLFEQPMAYERVWGVVIEFW